MGTPWHLGADLSVCWGRFHGLWTRSTAHTLPPWSCMASSLDQVERPLTEDRSLTIARHRRREPRAYAARSPWGHGVGFHGALVPRCTSFETVATWDTSPVNVRWLLCDSTISPLPGLCVQCPHKVHLLHQVAVFQGFCASKKTSMNTKHVNHFIVNPGVW